MDKFTASSGSEAEPSSFPVRVFFYGMSQVRAQGTSIATLLLPIGALAFWKC